MNGFVKEFFIRGDNSPFPQDFLRKAKPLVIDFMKNNPQTKVKMILNCLLVKDDLTTGEEDPFSHSKFHQNLEGTNWGEIFDREGMEMIENLENFNRRGSNWRFVKF